LVKQKNQRIKKPAGDCNPQAFLPSPKGGTLPNLTCSHKQYARVSVEIDGNIKKNLPPAAGGRFALFTLL
jgi:hypothetical protein